MFHVKHIKEDNMNVEDLVNTLFWDVTIYLYDYDNVMIYVGTISMYPKGYYDTFKVIKIIPHEGYINVYIKQ